MRYPEQKKPDRNSVQTSHAGSRDPTTAAIACRLSGSAWAGSWRRGRSQDSNPGTLPWDAAVLTAGPNACSNTMFSVLSGTTHKET